MPPDNMDFKFPPISYSDLEGSQIDSHGHDGDCLLDFNYATVPFDFDGKRLMWLTYIGENTRELCIYSFQT